MLVAHDNCCRLAPVDGANVSAGCIQVGHEDLQAEVRQVGTGSLVSASRNTLQSPTASLSAKQLPQLHRMLQQQSGGTLAQSVPHGGLLLRRTQAGHKVCAAPVGGRQAGCQAYDKTTRIPFCWLICNETEDCTTAPKASPGSLQS